jgi:TDG/mug DNA glycosylase family protein
VAGAAAPARGDPFFGTVVAAVATTAPKNVTDPDTVWVYERNAAEYRRRRKAYDPERAERFAAAVATGAVRLDLGCGPGLYADLLGRPVVGSDPAMAMCVEAASAGMPTVRHGAEALPFRPRSLGGVWAWKCLQHLSAAHLPLALAEVHRALPVGGRLHAAVFRGDPPGVYEEVTPSEDDFPGRRFTWWEPEPFALLLEGGGFLVEELAVTDRTIKVECARGRTLADLAGPGLRLLVAGLNASLYAADTGIAYGRPGNRFWPAAVEAGIVSRPRDPWHALRHHGVGFTDLVKRATVAAAELTPEEFRHGLTRLDHLCGLVRPAAVAVCGVTGWRHATGDRRATSGWQDRTLGGAPVYVLPNPSGLNAHTTVADLAGHLRVVAS